MAKPPGNFSLGKSETFDVALQRPNVNLKEAENQGEQAEAAARTTAPPVKFSKHGAFPGGNPAHSVMDLFGKD